MAKKAPSHSVQPWCDPGLKCLLTLSWLLQQNGRRALTAAIARHVGDEDMDPSDELVKFLVESPLSEAELATFEAMDPYQDWPPDLLMKLAPLFDGESEPFLVLRWDDVVRLPSLRRITGQREGAIPSPELVSRLPGLQSLTISTTGESGKGNQRSIPKYQSSGFFVDDIDCKGEWTTLKRAKSGPSKQLLAIVNKRFPREVYRKGKGGFRVELARVSMKEGALVARVELTLFRPEDPLVHTIGGEHRGPSTDLTLLDASELVGDHAAPRLEERIDRLFSAVASERCLPVSLT
jgi:hypothetical protein